MSAMDISWINLAFGYLIVGIPLAILYYYETGMVRTAVIALIRMTVQLFVVGIYLQFIFDLDNAFLNVAWALFMATLASTTIITRSELRMKYFILPVLGGVIGALLIGDGMMLGFVMQLDNPFNARYLVPISGMMLGNSMNSGVIGLRTFYKSLREKEAEYQYYLSLGAGMHEAAFPFVRDSMKTAYSPGLGTMENMGLVSLPGMMTGQILGGSDPSIAIKYQIMIMLAIHSGNIISVFLTLWFSRRLAVNEYLILKKYIFI